MSSIGRRFVQLTARLPILQIIAIGAVFAYGVVTLPGLGTWISIKTILTLASLVGLAATGQTVLILIGGFDLSIPSFIVASALVVTTIRAEYHWSFAVALLISLVCAACLGALAGQICHRFQIQPLIVTLAIGAVALGLAEATSGGIISGQSPPPWLSRIASPNSRTFGVGIPPMVAIWALVAVGMGIFLHRTVPGRRLLATGASARAAEYSTVSTRRVWTFAFAFSGIVSALVALLVLGFGGSVDGTSGAPYLFESVVAVVVGGTIFGGPGDYTRTVVGALFVTVVSVVLVGHGYSTAVQQIVYGVVILLAVTFYGRERRLRDRV